MSRQDVYSLLLPFIPSDYHSSKLVTATDCFTVQRYGGRTADQVSQSYLAEI